tara:strand:- start:2291 stop:2731 length:441 start_codon:yes stop_codon:yes gene_type:complete
MAFFKKIPLSPVAQKRFAETKAWFDERRESRKKELGGGVEIVAAAPVGGAAASIKQQNDAMGIQDPAKPGFGAQVIPQNQPPIQGAGQAPVGMKRRRGTTDAPYSKAYVEGQKATQKWFSDAHGIRETQTNQRAAEIRRKNAAQNQ